jgi:hypothetical protein
MFLLRKRYEWKTNVLRFFFRGGVISRITVVWLEIPTFKFNLCRLKLWGKTVKKWKEKAPQKIAFICLIKTIDCLKFLTFLKPETTSEMKNNEILSFISCKTEIKIFTESQIAIKREKYWRQYFISNWYPT